MHYCTTGIVDVVDLQADAVALQRLAPPAGDPDGAASAAVFEALGLLLQQHSFHAAAAGLLADAVERKLRHGVSADEAEAALAVSQAKAAEAATRTAATSASR